MSPVDQFYKDLPRLQEEFNKKVREIMHVAIKDKVKLK